MYIKQYLGLIAISAFVSCNNANKAVDVKDTVAVNNTDTTLVNTATITTAVSFKDKNLEGIFSAYNGLKNKLVATNFADSKVEAEKLATALKGFKGCETALDIANKIVSAKDIKSQRAAFTSLNVELIPVFKHAELKAGAIYLQHCPMANNGDGGDWLSSEKKIQNPYYGDEMMECGRVVEEIKAK